MREIACLLVLVFITLVSGCGPVSHRVPVLRLRAQSEALMNRDTTDCETFAKQQNADSEATAYAA